MKTTDRGIFIHRLAYSDTSLIITFFTKSSGLKKFIFKGGKKKAHSLFPMSIGELSFYDRKESSLLQLTAVDPATSHQFQFDPIKSTIAFFLAEVIGKCVHQDEVDSTCYDFVEQKVEELDASEDYQYFPINFLVDFTEILGVQPYVKNNSDLYFNLDEGTFESHSRIDLREASGAPADLIRNRILGNGTVDYTRMDREQALETMLDYYRIHIPNFGVLDSYEIVKEILHA